MSQEYIDFVEHIKSKLGIDLNLYKQAQMQRRITSLRNKNGYTNFPAYYKALDKSKPLLKEFIDRITINVSEFFRNVKSWETLKKDIFPFIIKDNKKISIWSAACSTGEEAYSIAIMMKEYFPHIAYEILATDIDQNVLDKAKQGIYQEKALKEVPFILKRKYFHKNNDLFYINHTLKQNITFKKHNLLADRYPQNIQLILCRNVLIYFTDEAKESIYHKFSSVLAPSGILFIGSTEQIFNPQKYHLSLLETFFYQKK
ncbi:CheR family methyltransferase [Virgibacillus alimentarius]|uniref:protein-glutamate O-methyltransferase n=1 Tax=Virgibacillus alimentarius TaxID=698769 RepID=A0ABS4S5P2_9BACI|nr:protein-glutamate O-methyltransferase CheR [Virgibacillus alimentarius]MBP2256381.1 chemotaxis protein methyltransferase CheR [Virgibacillus alimentarius]